MIKTNNYMMNIKMKNAIHNVKMNLFKKEKKIKKLRKNN